MLAGRAYCPRRVLENPVVGPRASGFATGKDKKQAISVYIVDAAGRRPVTKQAARSQIGFFDRLPESQYSGGAASRQVGKELSCVKVNQSRKPCPVGMVRINRLCLWI